MTEKKHFVLIDETGRIVGTGFDSPQKRFVPPGQRLIIVSEPSITENTHYINEADEPVAYSSQERTILRQPPTPTAQWNGRRRCYEEHGTIDMQKAYAWHQLKQKRSAAVYSTFEWDGSLFDADQESQRLIGDAVLNAFIAQSMGQNFSIDWTLADNSIRTLSAADLIQVGLALAAHVNSAHKKGRAKREAIKKATNESQLRGIRWD